MVVAKNVTLTFPLNSLQVINYTTANYFSYNVTLPAITADSQMGTEITFIKVTPVTTSTTTNTNGQFFLGPSSGQLIYSGTGSSTTLNTANYVFFYTYVKLVAIRFNPGVYGWYVVNVS